MKYQKINQHTVLSHHEYVWYDFPIYKAILVCGHPATMARHALKYEDEIHLHEETCNTDLLPQDLHRNCV